MKRISLWVSIALLSLTPCIPAFAQTVTGTIRGNITDSSGAVISGATVTATDLATGIPTAAKSNDAGDYAIRFLQIGRYKLTIEAPGFETSGVGPFSLEIDQVAQFNIALKPGAASTTVEVTEQAQPVLDTSSPTLGETFTENTIESTPLNGRDFSQLTAFTAGSVSTGYGSYGSQNSIERSTSATNEADVNGNRQQSNNYLLDGQEINEPLNNTIGYNPSPDSLAQMRVIASNANAEFGNVNGGAVIAVTKSGTNQWHGSLFGYLEDDTLDANSWSNDNNVIPTPKSPYTQSIFGGTLGGPILKDKLFFFVDYEGVRNHTGGQATYSVAPATFRTGNLSSVLNVLGIQLYNSQVLGTNGQPVPYVNDQIPITSPVATYLFSNTAAYPLPNNPTSDPMGIYNNFIGPSNTTIKNDQGDVKIDWHLRASDVISGRYSQGYARDATVSDPIPVEFPSASDYPDHFGTATWVHTLSPAIVNSFQSSYARIQYNSGVTTDPSGIFGLNGNKIVGIPSKAQPAAGFSEQSFAGSGNGYPSSFGANPTPEIFIDNLFQYSDDLTWQKGKHLLKFGAEFTRYQFNSFYPGNDGELGTFTYTGLYSSNPFSTNGGATGYSFADFLTDRVNNVAIGDVTGLTGQRQWRDSVFAQDDYQVNGKLTLNVGIRWDYFQPWYEVNNKEANLNFQTGAIEYAGVDGNSRALYNANWTEFQPRIGFAYSLSDRTIVRGGYGTTSYMEGTGANLRLTQNPPFHTDFEQSGENPTVTSGVYSPGVYYTTTAGFPTVTPPTTTFYAWTKNFEPSITQEISLGVERELTRSTVLSVGYVGVLASHLTNPEYGNQLTAPGATAPFASVVGQSGVEKTTASNAASNYNALQATLRQHLTAGLEFTINYTYSKSLTNDIGYYGVTNSNSGLYYQQNVYDLAAEWGPAGFDVRHAINASGVYALPFGRGRTFGGNWNRVVDSGLGGWRLAVTDVSYSGMPVTVSSPANYSSLVYAYTGAARPNQNLPLHPVDRSTKAFFGTQVQATGSAFACGPNEFNGKCTYSQQPDNAFGDVRPGSLEGPTYEQVDMSLDKQFNIWRTNTVAFRADFFNALNIASYSTPDSGATDANFGEITGTNSTSRTVQLSLKYTF